MNKRYMDFVPAKNVDKRSAVVSGAPRRVNVAGVAKTTTKRTTTSVGPKVVMPGANATPRTRMVRRDVSRHMAESRTVVQPKQAVRSEQVVRPKQTVQKKEMVVQRTTTAQKTATGFAIKSDTKLGEIEDLSPRFVNVDVPKRPLGEGLEHNTAVAQPSTKDEVKEVKSRRLIGRFRNKNAARSASKDEKNGADKADTFVTPRPAFINQDKIAKRPLSKNIYQKQTAVTDEQVDKGPVAIIAKPEKESKAGLVVAIILTIILGAVAGTVAFLLLPK